MYIYLLTICQYYFRLIAHTIRKWKRKARRQFNQNEENAIDLGMVRGNRDTVQIENEGSPRQLTCPQLLAISGELILKMFYILG
jgi:hypothetical protein